jgi:hypothetical protein
MHIAADENRPARSRLTKVAGVGVVLSGVLLPLLVAPSAWAMCPTETYMATPTAAIVSRAAQDSQGYDARNRTTAMTGTFTVDTQTTVNKSLTGSVSITTEMEASLWKVAKAKVSTTYGASFTAEVSDTNAVGRSVNAYAPAGQYWIYYFGVDRVQTIGKVYRDNSNCTTTYLGAKTLTAPSNHYVFWSTRVA